MPVKIASLVSVKIVVHAYHIIRVIGIKRRPTLYAFTITKGILFPRWNSRIWSWIR
jgi:hypothetical protein